MGKAYAPFGFNLNEKKKDKTVCVRKMSWDL